MGSLSCMVLPRVAAGRPSGVGFCSTGDARAAPVHLAGGASAMGYTTSGIRNIALVGQAGAGKTSLLETLLVQAGAIRAPGRLARGTTVSDFDPAATILPYSLGTATLSF